MLFPAAELALAVSVVAGAALQRIAGMGFAMVVAPLAILLLPGQQGVVFANLCGATAAFLLLGTVRRDVDWRRLALLSVTSVAGAVLGALVVRSLDVATFRVVVGIVLLLGIGLSLVASKTTYEAPPVPASLAAGTATGMLVTMSGIGGPPMSIYAIATRWDHQAFAATMQPFVVLTSLIGAGAVTISTPNSAPVLEPMMWVFTAVGLPAGLIAGNLLHRVVPARIGRLIVILLGIVGALTAIGAGLTAAPTGH